MSNSIVTDEIALRALRVFAAEIHADNLPLLIPAMRAALLAVADDMVKEERDACVEIALGAASLYEASAKASEILSTKLERVRMMGVALDIEASIRARSQKTEPPK